MQGVVLFEGDCALVPVCKLAGVVAWAKVDLADAAMAASFNWRLTNGGYATRTLKNLSLHREIMQSADDCDVDHINGNKLDNRRANLRLCSRSANMQNQPKRTYRHACTSRFKGVTRKHNLWYVQLGIDGRRVSGGYFKDEVAAALAYDRLAREHHGPLAHVNFPEEGVS
jgi:hypothetical protein